MEVDQKDPAGVTRPYRLLVPASWYEGGADITQPGSSQEGLTHDRSLEEANQLHRSPSFREYSSESNGSRDSSDSLDGPPPRRLDDRALNPRFPDKANAIQPLTIEAEGHTQKLSDGPF